MTSLPPAEPPDTPRPDPYRPGVARVLAACTSGPHTYAADRLAAEGAAAIWPGITRAAAAHRRFLGMAVELAAMEDIKQILDLGAGMPDTKDVVHSMRAHIPDAPAVVVDVDPLAVRQHRYAWRTDTTHFAAVESDALDMTAVLANDHVRRVLDWDCPILVTLGLLLHLVPSDDRVMTALHTLRDALAPGSMLVISHLSANTDADELAQRQFQAVLAYYAEHLGVTVTLRTAEQIRAMVDGLVPCYPGVADVAAWCHANEAVAGRLPLPASAATFVRGVAAFTPPAS